MGRVIVELLSPHGSHAERRYIFDNGIASVGRSYSNDIILDDPFVSPRHLLISGNASMVEITDLASENGTQVNGEAPLKNQGIKVNSGDEISIGKTRLKLLLPDHPVEPAKPISKVTDLRNLCNRKSVVIAFGLLALGLTVWVGYQEKPSGKFWGKDFYLIFLEYFFGAILYLGVLGFITYFKCRKTYFNIHLTVYNAATIFQLFYLKIDPFIYFWVSSQTVSTLADSLIHFGIFMVMVGASIRLTTDSLTGKGLLKLAGVSILITLLAAWGSLQELFNPSNDPSYSANMAPYLKPVFEPQTLGAFLEESGRDLYKPGP